MIGKVISHYVVSEKLGEGGMGEVYLAEDTRLGRKVALKFLPRHITDSQSKARFMREAKATATLNYPNIVTLYEVGEYGDQSFIAMEYVDGYTLKDLISQRKLATDEAIGLGKQICEGLIKAHHAGIVHRDIKPGNILINGEGLVKITDFGLAKIRGVSHLTKVGSTLGTLNYMSPEQLCNEDVDHRSDIFSFGVVLYEMITGQLPFKGDSDAVVIYLILNKKPEPLRQYTTEVSGELQRIVDKALQRNRDRRYQRVDDLFTDLKRDEDSGSGSARRAVKNKRRKTNRAVTVTAGLVIVAALVAFFITNILQRQMPGPEGIVQPVITQAQPLTTAALIPEVDPDISPDGSKVIYSANENENWDVWLHHIASGQKLNITKDHSGYDGSARWSPDGNWIAFNSSRDGGGIYLVSEFGGSVRQITSLDSRGLRGISWSFDGKKIAYTINGALNIVTVGDRIKTVLPLPHDCSDPAWSPEGNRIVYLTPNGQNWQIRTVSAEGVDPVIVFEGPGRPFAPLWSSDGKGIFFKWWRRGVRDLWWIPVDNKGNPRGAVKRLTTGWGVFDYSLSRDGTRLAYCKGTARFNIWSIPSKTDRVLKVGDAIQVTAENQSMRDLAISPDLEWFAFTSNKHGMNDMFIIRKDGTHLRRLTADNLYERGLCWSPDGSRIAYHADEKNNSDIYTVSISGGAVRSVIDHPANDLRLSWSPKGDAVIFQSDRTGNWDIWMSSLQDNKLRQLTEYKGYDGNAKFSPDGHSIAFFSDRSGAFEIYIMSVETGEKRELTSIKSDEILTHIWAHDNKTIYIANNPKERDRRRIIWEVRVEDGVTRRIFDTEELFVQEGLPASLAKDRERLYFIRGHSVADVWTAELEYK